MSGGVVADDIGGSADEGGTEVGAGGEDVGVGISEEVKGGNSDEAGDDIGGDDAAVVALPVDVEGGLKKKKKKAMNLAGISLHSTARVRTVRSRTRTTAHL